MYGYDEFGDDTYNTQGKCQPFGYTGYRYDNVADTYFAQAREYVARVGRFAGEDKVKSNEILALNSYLYAYENPLKYIDLDGNTAIDILKTGAGLAAGTSMLDSPLPGPMDIAALIILGGALTLAGGVAVYDIVNSREKDKDVENVIADTATESMKPTIIYRLGSGNATNLTPRVQDITGLSYQLSQPIANKYTYTTIEAVNNTSVKIRCVGKILLKL